MRALESLRERAMESRDALELLDSRWRVTLLHLLTLHRLRTVELSTYRFLFDSYVQQRRRMKFLEALLALLLAVAGLWV